MIKQIIEDFDLQQVAASGQCFRMNPIGNDTYAVVAGSSYIEVSQNGSEFIFYCDEGEFENIWWEYFDFGQDYGKMKASVDTTDLYMEEAIKYGAGVRILKQDLWEIIVTFIISQQNNIPRIKKCVESICTYFGEEKVNFKGETYYTFPSIKTLAKLPEDGLKACNLGYRSKYILKTARMIYEGEISLDTIRKMDYEMSKSELLKLFGVGTKVAECICLYGLYHIEAFPIDTHVKQILEKHYPDGFPFERYQGYAGILQQYMFYYKISK